MGDFTQYLPWSIGLMMFSGTVLLTRPITGARRGLGITLRVMGGILVLVAFLGMVFGSLFSSPFTPKFVFPLAQIVGLCAGVAFRCWIDIKKRRRKPQAPINP